MSNEGTDYYLPENTENSVANFDIANGTFESGIDLPIDLRGQSIGKAMFIDAFNKLGGSGKIKEISGFWIKGKLGDNFELFKAAPMKNATAKEAAFSTKTGG